MPGRIPGGQCGRLLVAFSTFSTFGYETLALVRDNSVGLALWNVGLSVGVGLCAVWAGHAFLKLLRL